MLAKSELLKLYNFFPLVSLWALIYACVGLYFYYVNFNINIFQYLDLNEIVQITLARFIIIIVFFGLYIFIETILSFEKKENFLDAGPKKNFKLFLYPFYVAIILYLVLFLLDKYLELNNFFSTIRTFSLSFIVFILPVILSLLYIYSSEDKKQVATVVFMLTFYYSIIISGLLGHYSYEKLISDPVGSSIIFNDNLIESSSDYFYIGHTKNYVFFYNDSLKSVDIYSSPSVSRMTLKYSF